MKAEATFYVIWINKKMTDIMQAVDMFEEWKVVGEPHSFVVTYKDGSSKLTWERVKKVMDALAEQDTMPVAFIHLNNIESEGELRINTGAVEPWINPKVKVISTGKKWFLAEELKDFIESKCSKLLKPEKR